MSMMSAVKAKTPISSARRLNAKARPACPRQAAYRRAYALRQGKPRLAVSATIVQRQLDFSA